MTRRRVFRNAGMAVAQVLFSGAMLAALFYYLLRTIGPVQLGVWSVVLATAAAARLSELGLSGGVVKFVASYVAQQQPRKAAGVVQTAAVSVAVLLGVAGFPLYSLIALLLRYVLPPATLADGLLLLPYALGSLWISAVASVFLAGLDGIQRIDTRSLITIAGTGVHLGVVILLVPGWGLLGLAYAQLAQAVLMLLLAWLTLRRFLTALPALPFHWQAERFREMLRYGLNLQLAALLQIIFDPVTKALLSKFADLGSVSYYDMANRMVTQFRALLVSANQVVVPVIAGIQEGEADRIRAVYADSYRLLLLLAIPLYGGIAAGLPVICELWLGRYQETFVIFGALLIGGWFLNTLVGPAYFSNIGTGKLFWNTAAHVVIGVLNLLFGVVLGMLFGGIGVIVAFVVSLVLGSCLIMTDVHRQYGLSFNDLLPRSYSRLLAAAVLGILLNWAIYSGLRNHYSVAFIGTVGLLLYAALVAPCLWRHPMRGQLIAWLRRGR